MERYSFSGKGNILIKAGVAAKYGSENYAANEPIAYFTDVFINLDFQYLEKTPRVAIENLAVQPKSSPSNLHISNIKISESLQTLLYRKKSDQTKYRTIIKRILSEGGSLYLPVESDQSLVGDLFVYDLNKIRVTEYTLDQESKQIIGLNDGYYTIFYQINQNASSIYSLEFPNYPNMAVEVEILGNLNGTTGAAVLHLNNVKLLTRPSLNMESETPFVDDLDFAILSKSEAEVYYYAN